MIKKLFLLMTCTLLPLMSQAKDNANMYYTVSVDTVGHYLNVHLTYISKAKAGKALTLKMPVWAPGYYLIVDFPKYLVDFKASRTDGTPLSWTKFGKTAWVINRPDCDTVNVDYRVYANARSVAESRVEGSNAFIAPNGVFMYQKGHKCDKVFVHFDMPSNWQFVSTGLKAANNTVLGVNTYEAPCFDILYDSPMLLGNQLVDKFQYEGHDYEFALASPIGYSESPFKEDFKKIVSATTGIMKHVPYDNYCLIHLGKGPGGLEHLNSQACYTEGTFHFESQDEYVRYLDFTAHEYFHLYNVKHIRPIELGPFNYDHEVYTPLLWVSEGFTCYYSAQILRQAGLISTAKQLDMYSEYFADTENYEGHKHMSLRQSSYDIWLNFFNTQDNRHETTISYYIKGPVLGVLFDAQLRAVTNGECSLDDLMRLLYNRYDQQLSRGFTEEEFWAATQEIAGTSDDAKSAVALLRRYVDTTDDIDYDEILSMVGLQVDNTTWKLSLIKNPSKHALALRKAMIGE